MKSLYRVKCKETHTVENFQRFQERDRHNLHVHYRVDHMENEEHRENSIESVYSKFQEKNNRFQIVVHRDLTEYFSINWLRFAKDSFLAPPKNR